VLLSVRDPAVWAQSMRETVWGIYHGDSVIHHVNSARAVLDENWRRYLTLMSRITWQRGGALAGGDPADFDQLAATMGRWTEQVKRDVPAERLLVWDPADGWGPLCEFLEVPVPDGELPRLNDTASFREGIIGGAIDVLNEWWAAREQPASGLHGAPL